VILQTINPDHYAIRFAANQDYAGFFEKELNFRRFMKYPPFAAIANILVRAAKQEDALRMSTELGHHLTPPLENMKIMGPAEAPVQRLKAEYRYQLLIKSGSRKDLNALLRRARDFARSQKWSATALVIDVDPLTLL
jgi:primosomal protein N' (replication factor Y)